MKAMILAAGGGTRLYPLTADRPKPMVDVAGRPLLDYVLAWLRHYDISQVAINLHHHPQVMIDHVGDGAAFGLEVTYSVEDEILGTAGGVKRLAPFFDEPFLVVYGDVLTNMDLRQFADFHFAQAREPHLSMSLYHVPNPQECGIVALDDGGKVTQFVEKPGPTEVFSDLASAGVLVIDPELLEYVPEGQFFDFGRDLFPKLLKGSVPIYGWPVPEGTFLIDIGTPGNYAEAQRRWPNVAGEAFHRSPSERAW